MVGRKKVRLGELLIQGGLLSEEQLQAALKRQKETGGQLGQVLADMQLIDEGQILRVLSEQLLMPVIELRHYKFKPEVVRMLPEAHARDFRAIVLRIEDGKAVVGMVDPTNLIAQDNLERILAKPVKVVLVRESELMQAIGTVYRRTEEIVTLASELGEELSEDEIDLATMSGAEMTGDDAPVVRLLQSMFDDAVQVNASDIHIEPEEGLLRIRQRVDGFLQEQIIDETRIAAAMVTRLKLMSGLDISEKRLPQDGRFQMRVKDRRIDVRMSTMPVQNGESVVMRLLDQSNNLLSLNELGLPAPVLSRLRRLVKRPHGMILVTGPTGSGKTTTLYSALSEINVAEHKIITVEDPVEYRLQRINQVQVNSKIGLNFSRVLRSTLRQDPDVVLVGEIRDPETAEIAVRAAMTGHLVLSTLHTNDSISTVHRLVDMGVPAYMAATALAAVIAQRLVRRVCEACSEPYSAGPGELVWLKTMGGDDIDTTKLRKGAGCQYCNNTGYRGRIGLYELLELDSGLSDLLRQEQLTAFENTARSRPYYRSLSTSGLEYVLQGLTTITEVIRVTGSLEEQERMADDAAQAAD